MDKSAIKLEDIGRILTGDTPPEFFIEILIRGIFVYIILMGALRIMGKRMATRLTRNELAAISTLAAAIGIPMFTPDRGILPGLVIAIVVVCVQRLVAWLSIRSQRIERLSQGYISTLVEDGCLKMKEMKKARISREQLMAQLRAKKILHLGQVKRMYMEANGAFTVLRHTDAKPGLSVIPAFDKDFLEEQRQAKDILLCSYCGEDAAPGNQDCAACGANEKTKAVC
ncbi:DUF421 domain-containing protein [Chitinophaga rhizophila]|uniref:DUF421 domain-containing protein n=1 Tax=Chitinophaga rhizophila TaxID=2866212 RepID=A0ABS7G7N6_9BACT|nr:YetF domain-containing protein [Chitinophaga rhizophila]MBW8682742.1 DUF421 domain-containing protein [Chitinophaga rhizophila]